MFNTSKPSSVVSHNKFEDEILSQAITKYYAPLVPLDTTKQCRIKTTRMKPEQCIMAKGDSAASHHY